MHIHTYIYINVCVCVCVYVYIYSYTHIGTYIYTYTVPGATRTVPVLRSMASESLRHVLPSVDTSMFTVKRPTYTYGLGFRV